jgi:CarD family transcriptional regulator
MFRSGDKILHPLHGVGLVESIKKQEVLGEMKEYYVVNLTMKRMKIMVPIDKCEEVGVRKITHSEQIDQVFSKAKGKKVTEMPANWNRRYKFNLDKIKTGDLKESVEVFRNLRSKERKKGLSMGEKKMLDNVRQLLVGEYAYSKNVKLEDALGQIEKALH